MSEMPSSGFQTPLPLRAVIPAQVQPAEVYTKPTEQAIKDVQRSHIYDYSKPAKVDVMKA